jgi:hypothetical protein
MDGVRHKLGEIVEFFQYDLILGLLPLPESL